MASDSKRLKAALRNGYKAEVVHDSAAWERAHESARSCMANNGHALHAALSPLGIGLAVLTAPDGAVVARSQVRTDANGVTRHGAIYGTEFGLLSAWMRAQGFVSCANQGGVWMPHEVTTAEIIEYVIPGKEVTQWVTRRYPRCVSFEFPGGYTSDEESTLREKLAGLNVDPALSNIALSMDVYRFRMDYCTKEWSEESDRVFEKYRVSSPESRCHSRRGWISGVIAAMASSFWFKRSVVKIWVNWDEYRREPVRYNIPQKSVAKKTSSGFTGRIYCDAARVMIRPEERTEVVSMGHVLHANRMERSMRNQRLDHEWFD